MRKCVHTYTQEKHFITKTVVLLSVLWHADVLVAVWILVQ